MKNNDGHRIYKITAFLYCIAIPFNIAIFTPKYLTDSIINKLVSTPPIKATLNTNSVKKLALNYMSHENSSKDFKISKFFTSSDYKGFISDMLNYNIPNKDIDLNRIYLGFDPNTLPISKYKPQSLTNSDKINFYSIKQFCISDSFHNLDSITHFKDFFGTNHMTLEGIEKLLNMKEGEIFSVKYIYSINGINLNARSTKSFSLIDLNQFHVSFGKDADGIYLSLYDMWDFGYDHGFLSTLPFSPEKLGTYLLPQMGTPIHFYDRFYLDNYGLDLKTLHLSLVAKQKDRNSYRNL